MYGPIRYTLYVIHNTFMISSIISTITSFIIHIISTLGYPGVGFLMAIQTVAIPMPSEIILPFAGSLVAVGKFSLLGISLIGALGSCIGASIAYYIGYKGGRPLVERFGKYILISHEDLDRGDKFLQKYEAEAILVGMVLPIVRSFISFPAGIARVSYKKFVAYVFISSFAWSLGLSYIGMRLGQNWETLRERFRGVEYVVVVLIIVAVVWWVYRHLNSEKREGISGNKK
jgi:membrane protein DedA with SNARE-associated domain